MDAFHCPGAVMFLFKGKMGTVLHTGDFRFSEQMLSNPYLCPPEKRDPAKNSTALIDKAITVDVDYLHLDNTFANPEYDFPSREEAYSQLKKIVAEHGGQRIYLFSYNLGKEEVFLNLAKDFDVKICVDKERYHKVKLLNLEPDLFTTNEKDIEPTEEEKNRKGTKKPKIHIKQIRDLK